MKFSFRSLLIFVTLIACFCGIVSTLIYLAAKSGEAWNATAEQRVDDDDPGTPMGVMTGPVDADPIYDPEALAETSRELQAEMDAVSVEPAKIPIFEVKVGIDEVHGKKIVETIVGKCIAVTDGDTIKILVDNKEIKVRLDSIDCPELKAWIRVRHIVVWLFLGGLFLCWSFLCWSFLCWSFLCWSFFHCFADHIVSVIAP